MKISRKIFALCSLLFAVCAASSVHAACSVANLTKCIDSACDTAPEYGAAARCIVCGTTAAATANKALESYKYGGAVTGLQSLAIGYSSATALDTKNAPTDPGKRYAWASEECIKKNAGCTADDVAKNYDKLIEQSCRAALSEKEYEAAFAAQRRSQKTEATCRADMQNCLIVDRRCGANYMNCEADADFDRNFSECSVETGCGSLGMEFTAAGVARNPLDVIRVEIKSARDSYFAARAELLKNTVAAHQAARAMKINNVKSGCADGSLKDACVANMCGYIGGNCADNPARKSIAFSICGYIDVACQRIK